MIKGAIFDLDGVLLDSISTWRNFGAIYLRRYGLTPKSGLNDTLFSMSMEQGAEYLCSNYDLPLTAVEILEEIHVLLEDFYFNKVKAKSGAADVLDFLKKQGVRIVAATSSPKIHVEKALERNSLMPYIEKVFTTGEIGKSKHFPDIYLAAADFLQTDVDRTIVFEDSLYALKTAAEAGFITAGVYDADGEPDQKSMENTADVYLKDIKTIIGLWDGIDKVR